MRQLLGKPSTAWAIGVVLPVAMVLLDPIVFRGSGLGAGQPLLAGARPFGYMAIATGMALVLYDLLRGRPHAAVAGALAAAAAFSAGLGVILLPFSLAGILLFGMGLLGLSPFFCAAVLGYRAVGAYRGAPPLHRTAHAAVGFGLFFIACSAVQRGATGVWERAVAEIRSSDPAVSSAGAERLARWGVLLDAKQLADPWRAEPDLAKKERLAAAYRRLTGQSLEAMDD